MENTDQKQPQFIMSIHPHTICCHIDKLDEELLKIEKFDGFYKWIRPPLEQLDEVLSPMVNPEIDTIPPTMIFWIELKSESKE